MKMQPVEEEKDLIDRKVQDSLAEEEAWKKLEDEEMICALKAALGCKKCQIAVTVDTMHVDIKSGAYIATHNPPHFARTRTRDQMISPLDTETRQQDVPFWKRVPLEMLQLYLQQVEQNRIQLVANDAPHDPELAILFAHYQMDYHIHQHFLSRASVLTLCRDADDMHHLRWWQWEMTKVNGQISAWQWNTRWKRRGWLNDENLTMEHQTAMWQRSWRTRRTHLREVRARWVVIMEERRRQRQMLILKQKAMLTVRVYCGRDLWGIRRIERAPDDGLDGLIRSYPKKIRSSVS